MYYKLCKGYVLRFFGQKWPSMSHKLFINFFLVGALRDAENVHK